MRSWGVIFIIVGIGSYVLPLVGFQFILVSALNESIGGPFGSLIAIGVGAVLFILGMVMGGSKSGKTGKQ